MSGSDYGRRESVLGLVVDAYKENGRKEVGDSALELG